MYIGRIRNGAHLIAYALSHFCNKLKAKRVNESSTIFFKTQCNDVRNEQIKDSRFNKEQLKNYFMVHGSALDLKPLNNDAKLRTFIKWP